MQPASATARTLLLLAVSVGVAVLVQQAVHPIDATAAAGDEGWDPRFFLPGLNGTVAASIADASGGMYVAGSFTTAGGTAARGVARWDGDTWHAVGGSLSGSAAALAIHGSDLYVGGTFSTAGGGAANNVARWDGTAWHALGAGTNGRVEALAVDGDGNVYAGGTFTQAGGSGASRVAVWDGADWSPLGAGADATVSCLAIDGSGGLLAGGQFQKAGGTSVNHVARWDGSTWHSFGGGLNDDVLALAVDGSTVYAGGWFTFAGGDPNGHYLAAWNGTTWGAVGGVSSGILAVVRAVVLDDQSELYVGGGFNRGGPTGRRSVAHWNGTSWGTLGDGMDDSIHGLAFDGSGRLHAAGEFALADEAVANRFASWDGAAWQAPADGGSGVYDYANPGSGSTRVNAMTIHSDGDMVVAGTFSAAGVASADRIARWDGESWHDAGADVDPFSSLSALAADASGNVYVGGSFSTIGGVSARNVARWDGSSWSALGTGTNRSVASLSVSDSGDLYAAGLFAVAGSAFANNTARWDGTQWYALGSGWSGASVIAAGDSDVYACCDVGFGSSGAEFQVGSFDGSTWSDFGGPFNDQVTAIAIDGDGAPFVVGRFTEAGGVGANRVAHWDGSQWAALGSGLNGEATALGLDSNGQLYVGGAFTVAGGGSAQRAAVWDGSSWSAIGSGLGDPALSMGVGTDDTVFFGGAFLEAGSAPSLRVAHYSPSGWPPATPTPTSTNTSAPTETPEATATPSPSSTHTVTASPTAPATQTATATPTASASPTVTTTATTTSSPTATTIPTITPTPSITLTPSVTPTPSITPTPSVTPTPSTTPTPSATATSSSTPTATATQTATRTRTPTITLTPSPTYTPSPTLIPTATLPADADSRWDPYIGAIGVDQLVEAVAADGNGNVYVGGQLTEAGGVTVSNVAAWDGEGWDELDGGADSPVRALAVDDQGYAYMGGGFTFAGGLPIRNLARWDGFAWSPVGGGLGGDVNALTFGPDGKLYAGGTFSSAGGEDANHIAVWDGHQWSAIGDGIDDVVHALGVDENGRVFAGTERTDGATGPEYHVWYWNGEFWFDIYNTGSWIDAVVVGHDGAAYVGGRFAGGILRWDMSGWSTLGANPNGSVFALAVDGDGYVYAAGRFTTVGSLSANRVARWDGAAWTVLGSGLEGGDAKALAIDADGIYVGGLFTSAGGKTSRHVGWYHTATAGGPSPTPTPTSPSSGSETPTPEAGCHSLEIYPAFGGSVTTQTPTNCPAGYLDGTVVRLRATPQDGYRWVRWRGDAAGVSMVTSVVVHDNLAVGAVFTLTAEPRHAVLLLHGWKGFPGAAPRVCPPGGHPVRITRAMVDGGSLPSDDVEAFARHMLDDELDVWLASYTTGPLYSAPLTESASCLQRQMQNLLESGVEHVSIVAHDMGGIVARAYLESEPYVRDRAVGRAAFARDVITLGAPHAGADHAFLGCNLEQSDPGRHAGICELPHGETSTLNGRTLNRRALGAAYQLVGGDRAPRPFRLVPLHSTVDIGDGVVSAESATGRRAIPAWPAFWNVDHQLLVRDGNAAEVDRHGVDANHRSPAIWEDPISSWYPSYFNRTGPADTALTETYQCVRQLLGLSEDGCDVPPELALPGTDEPTSANLLETGDLIEGQAEAYPFVLDTADLAQVDLTWVTGTLGITLTSPTGQVIDPVYAVSHPDDMAYVGPGMVAGSGLFASYYLTSTVKGVYTATVRGASVPDGGTAFALSGGVHSPLTITTDSDRRVYSAGTSAVISAGLGVGQVGIEGADVRAYVTLPDGAEQTLVMAQQGGGVYVASLVVPGAGGRLPVRIVASGKHAGSRFARVALTELYVERAAVGLTGKFDDLVRDDNGDGLYESLDVTVGLTGTIEGPHWVSADLYDASGYFVAHSTVWVDLGTGEQSVTLRFDGDAIRQSGGDGPYNIRNLTVAESEDGHTPVLVTSGDLWATSSWPATGFAATCYVVDVVIEPPGAGTVDVNPSATCNAGLQHAAGTQVTLTASAGSGFAFVGWEGDLSGSDPVAHVSVGPDRAVVARFILVATLTPTRTATMRPTATQQPSATVQATPSHTPTRFVTPTPSGTPAPTGTIEPTPTPGPPLPIYLPKAEKP